MISMIMITNTKPPAARPAPQRRVPGRRHLLLPRVVHRQAVTVILVVVVLLIVPIIILVVVLLLRIIIIITIRFMMMMLLLPRVVHRQAPGKRNLPGWLRLGWLKVAEIILNSLNYLTTY